MWGWEGWSGAEGMEVAPSEGLGSLPPEPTGSLGHEHNVGRRITAIRLGGEIRVLPEEADLGHMRLQIALESLFYSFPRIPVR